MGENAELLVHNDAQSIHIALTSWLRNHNVKYDDNMNNEELRQLYIKAECGQL